MFDHDGLSKVVLEQGPDATVVHNRNSGALIQTAQIMGSIAIKAEIQPFMGKIASPEIAPPLVGCIKAQSRAEDPAFEIIGIVAVGLYYPGRKAGWGK